jgi:hypothetical protein
LAFVLACVWVVAALAYSYPAIRDEIAEKRYLAEVQRSAPPMIPVDCDRARGQEKRDFIREDKNPDKCWMGLARFRQLYPEIAEAMDERASARFLTDSGLSPDAWDGSPAEEILKVMLLALIGPAVALGFAGGRRLRGVSPEGA